MRAASGGAYTYMRAAYMPHIRHVCGICAQARVYGMYAAYMRLPMPHAYMRLRPPPENAARIYVLGHRRVAALRVATLAESVHVLLCYLSTDVLLRYLSTDVLLRYLRVHHA
jgi:hypothetical protein